MAPATFSHGMAGKASVPSNVVVTGYSQLYFNKSLVKCWKLDCCLLKEKTIYKREERSSYRLWKNSRAFYAQKLTILQRVKFPIYYVTFCSFKTFSETHRVYRGHRALKRLVCSGSCRIFCRTWVTVANLGIGGSSYL